MSNTWLQRAKTSRNDEYYTLRADVERELRHYDFSGKSVYLPCDSPRASEFWRYFETRFAELGITKLVATHYFNGKDTEAAILEEVDGEVVRKDVPLEGKGDFRSAECRELMEACDVVVTNPPFSLIIEFAELVEETGADYLFVGPNHILTSAPIRKLIAEGRCHAGVNAIKEFEVAPGKRKKVAAMWFTSLDHGTVPGLPKFKRAERYPRYENVEGIEVGRLASIPADYEGVMGVPVTFFAKWDPEEFEILDVERHAVYREADGSKKKAYIRLMIRRKAGLPKAA